MIESSSSFIASSIPLLHNAVKSIIFKCAELLMTLFVFKLFSLLAARSKQFASYLMFVEDYIQRLLFLSSRGLSRAGLVILFFSILHVLASFYGTLLWALDSPGYIFRESNVSVADYANLRNSDPPYVLRLDLSPNSLQTAEASARELTGSKLFKPGFNYTLTGQVQRGAPEIVAPTRRDDVGARIWLDSNGFSVSPDSYAMWPSANFIASGNQTFPSCVYFGKGSAAWNCTFSNTFALGIVQTIVGRPEVHWDDASDLKLDSRYIRPNRVDNVWTSFGAGAGSAFMTQVFTVTKGTRRHVFVESAFRATMLTSPGVPFAKGEVEDLVKRTWSTDETERNSPIIGRIVGGIMSAQDKHLSYHFGGNAASDGNRTVVQSSWGFLTSTSTNSTSGKEDDVFSLISITVTNMTLIRSETIARPPTPFEKCDHGAFQNEAFGGKVMQSDCAAAKLDKSSSVFFGQVDTAAVLIVAGLGNGRSNVSSESLDGNVMSRIADMSDTMEALLIARAYIVSVDPALVTIRVDRLIAAMSGLQLLLSILAAVLAGAAWLALAFFADTYWSNTLLSSLVHTTKDRDGEKSKPGYMHNPPSVELLADGEGKFIAVSGKAVVLQDLPLVPMDSLDEGHEEPHEEGEQLTKTGHEPERA